VEAALTPMPMTNPSIYFLIASPETGKYRPHRPLASRTSNRAKSLDRAQLSGLQLFLKRYSRKLQDMRLNLRHQRP
jgi:hypothetical protein